VLYCAKTTRKHYAPSTCLPKLSLDSTVAAVRSTAKPAYIHYYCCYTSATACIHFAGLKAVGESVEEPLLYYENNLISTLTLLRELGRTKCRSFVFSSSATVYGTAEAPITEGAQVGVGITNPYGVCVNASVRALR
jgi:UDP-glucose 4-epimerase